MIRPIRVAANGIDFIKTARRPLWTDLCTNFVRPVLKVAITGGIYWAAGKAYRRMTGRNAMSDMGNGKSDILDLIKRRALETVTENVVSRLVDVKEKDEDGAGDMDKAIARILGSRGYFSRGDDFLPWKRSIMRVMLHRFWHDAETPVRLRSICGPAGSDDPVSIPVQTGYDKSEVVWESCLVSGHYGKVPVAMKFDSSGDRIMGSLVWFAKDVALVDRIQHDFRAYLIEKNYLKGQALDSNGELMDVERCPTWDDVVLPGDLMEKIKYHTVDFLEHLDEFKDRGLRTCRGNLWVGPPGTGKTTMGRILARQARGTATFLGIHTPSLVDKYDESDVVAEVFHMARALRPTILLLDDLDKAGDCVTKHLLGELDGMLVNDGIVIIATLNNVGALDLALRDRPNRFDMVAEFKLPDRERRKALFDLFVRDLDLDIDTDVLATNSVGLSPAHCKEVIVRAVIEEKCSKNGKALNEWITGCLEDVLAQHRLVGDGKKKEGADVSLA